MISFFVQDQPLGDTGGGALGAGLGLGFTLFMFLILFLWVAGLWKIFLKAGKPGWAAIVPIYNFLVLAEIAGKPGWWGIMLLIPFANVIFGILLGIALAKKFGKGAGYGLGLAFLSPIFYPLLGFGGSRYDPNAVT